ncbi:induced myeloid leukemia cell differentiation protein Mcl-1b [Nerophis ophidion]|uniref:induced myeloid leukemia cell differentiation protein Mcl-1b n=1 Tax=Nerophis ophidion TaxID=159077 RepID=UPI002AE04F05|nr:induced myeloid leukemia cell differentiation protein Mcl-1b [Nerophis ophidion]
MNINMMQTTRSVARNVTAGCMGLCPQNGVYESAVLCGSGAPSSPRLQRAVALEVQSGAAASLHRPSILEVSHKGGFATIKNQHDDIDDASLPCTPELLSPDDGVHAGNEALDAATKSLVSGFLTEFTGLSKGPWLESKAQSTMKRVVRNLLEKHRYTYNGILKNLCLDQKGDNMDFVGSVAKNIFSDGTTNWGRIASLVAFGAVVSQYLKDKDRGHCVPLVAQEISSFLLEHQRHWLVKNNSWDGFVDFFQEADPESKVRNTLMAFAGIAGIGATLALLIR